MRVHSYILIFLCFLPICNRAYSQKWVSFNGAQQGSPVSKKVLKDDASTYQIEVTINGLYDQLITNENGSFHRLSFGKHGTLRNPGYPALPTFTQLIAIPSGTRISPSIKEKIWEDINISTIYPTQPLLQEGETPQGFIINEQSYRQDFQPPLIIMNQEMNWRGINNVGLAICPFKYYPQIGKLSVLRSFVLQVDFLPNDKKQSAPLLLKKEDDKYGLFDNSVFTDSRHKVLNPRSDNYDYLIIVANSTIQNSNKLKEFRRWKALKGLKTKVVSVSTIGSTDTAIKNYIIQESSNGIQYVLFIGTHSDIPTYSMTSINFPSKVIRSDYWYGCLGGNSDYEADIPVGRFPTNQLSEFSNMVDKTIRYEMGQNLSNKVLFVAHWEGAGWGGYQDCCDTIIGNHTGEASYYTAYGASVMDGGNNATNSDVINYINQGMHIVNYRGHGSSNYWGGSDWGDTYWNASNETFYYSEVNNFSSNTNAVFLSVSCNTGNIMANNNMLEVFTRSPKGASAFVGSTSNSYTDPNTSYNIQMFHALYDQGTYRLGDINMNAHVSNIQTFSPGSPYNTGLATDNAFSYICGGDPTLEVWTDDPQALPNFDITSSGNSITIDTGISSGYYVFIVSLNGELVNSYWVTNNSFTFTKPDNKFYFAIGKHDYIPFVVYCDSEANTLQNVDVTENRFYDNTPFSAGEDVAPIGDVGDVIVNRGSALFIQKGSGGVLLDEGFKCEKGARLVIK